jgi:amino acid permease
MYFTEGGWLIGVISLTIAAVFSTVSIMKIIDCAIKLQEFNIARIANASFGNFGAICIEGLIFGYQFSISML